LNIVRFIEHSSKLIQGIVDFLNGGKVQGVEQSSSVSDFTNLTHVGKGMNQRMGSQSQPLQSLYTSQKGRE
jgi:hypothetical protein